MKAMEHKAKRNNLVKLDNEKNEKETRNYPFGKKFKRCYRFTNGL